MKLLPYTTLDWLAWSAQLAAEAAVITTAVRLPRSYRPHLSLFVACFVGDVWIRLTKVFVLEGAEYPFVGLPRALYHLETVLVTAWPAAVAVLAWWTFQNKRGPDAGTSRGASSLLSEPDLNRRPSHDGDALTGLRHRTDSDGLSLRILPFAVKAIVAAWLAFNAAMVAAYPLPRGWTQPALHAWQGFCVVAAAVAIILGWERRREHAASAAFLLAGFELAVATVGPYARDVFADWRTVGAAMYAVGFTLLAAQQWRWGRTRRAPLP